MPGRTADLERKENPALSTSSTRFGDIPYPRYHTFAPTRRMNLCRASMGFLALDPRDTADTVKPPSSSQ